MAPSKPAVRRLAAIVIADVVGFSRHMERDDAGTLTRLRALREEMIDPAVARHAGQIVKTAGDGMLIEFGSADAALRFAVEMQQEIAARNVALPDDERLEYRVGINLGDIIVDGADIAGDGVNVAARLQALAPPGGICVSSAVREQVHGSLAVGFDDIGDQQVKNIMRPIRVYQIRMGATQGPGAAVVRAPRAGVPLKRVILGSVALAAVTSIAALAWLQPWRAGADLSAPALSVAVLTFTNAQGDDRRFAEMLSDDLAASFSQLRWVKVAARNEAPNGVKPPLDAPGIGPRLGVRYLLDGDVRPRDQAMEVTTRLVDAATGTQVWSDRFDFPRGAARPDARAAGELFQHARLALFDTATRRAVHEHASATPMDLVLRGDDAGQDRWTPEVANAQRKLYEAALARDSDFVPALIRLADALDEEMEQNMGADLERLAARMDEVTARAIRLDPADARSWITRASSLTWLGRWKEAASANDRALALEPSNRTFVLNGGWIQLRTGHAAEALATFEKALAMDPRRDAWTLHFICKAHLFLGRYDDAVASCEKAAALNNGWLNQLYLCAAYAQHGDAEKAGVAKAALLAEKPGYTTAMYRRAYAASPPAFFDLVDRHLAAALRKAGIPDR